MNANELIELLDKNAGDGDTPIRQAATTLRQQHAEIEHLKELFGCDPAYFEPDKKAKTLDRELLDKTIIDQQNEIKELRKNLDVALMIVNKPAKTEDEGKVCARCGAIAYDPVITQKAKTLTDEEINELYADYQNPDYYSREVIFDQLGFARAILKKAKE